MKIHLKGDGATRTVWLNGKELDPKPSQKFRNHSPTGFAWGYGGSGPTQLALAVLLEVHGLDYVKRHGYHNFRDRVIAELSWPDLVDIITDTDLNRERVLTERVEL